MKINKKRNKILDKNAKNVKNVKNFQEKYQHYREAWLHALRRHHSIRMHVFDFLSSTPPKTKNTNGFTCFLVFEPTKN